MDEYIKKICDLLAERIPEKMEIQDIKYDPYNPYNLTLVLKPRDTKPRT